MNKITTHCCELMNLFLNDEKIPIKYLPIFREYYIPLLYKQKTTAHQNLFFCPWCGKKLSESLRDEWFDTLEKEYNLDDPWGKEQEKLIPQEFKTDEWWKKRGL